jgi:hypothetical protein
VLYSAPALTQDFGLDGQYSLVCGPPFCRRLPMRATAVLLNAARRSAREITAIMIAAGGWLQLLSGGRESCRSRLPTVESCVQTVADSCCPGARPHLKDGLGQSNESIVCELWILESHGPLCKCRPAPGSIDRISRTSLWQAC